MDIAQHKAVTICRYCRTVYTHPRTKQDKSTSTLSKHAKKHRKPAVGSSDSDQRPITTFAIGPATQTGLEELLLRSMVANYWPFCQFDDHAFRDLIRQGFPHLKIPNRKSIKVLLTSYANRARSEMVSRFAANDSQFSLAMDIWTSPNGHDFMGNIHSSCCCLIDNL